MPLYHQVRTILVDAMRGGELPAGTQFPSTPHLAGLMGVSMLTAHRALRNLAEEGWIDRGQGHRTTVRREPGSGPGGAGPVRICAAVSRQGHSHPGGVWPWLDAIEGVLAEPRPAAELLFLRYDSAQELDRVRADAILCLQPRPDEADALQRVAARMPLVVIGSPPAGASLHHVDVWHEDAARKAVRHLVQLGHRHLAFVLAPGRPCPQSKRLEGFLLELGASGLRGHDCVALAPTQAEPAHDADRRLTRLLQRESPPTALLVEDMRHAMNLACQLRRMGLHVPRDVSLVAFDDGDGGEYFDPPLTAVAEPIEDMARLAVARLMDLIHRRRPDGPVERAPARLIVRGSTTPPASGCRPSRRRPRLAAVG